MFYAQTIADIVKKDYCTVVIISKDGKKAGELIQFTSRLIGRNEIESLSPRRLYLKNGSQVLAGTPGSFGRGLSIKLFLVLDDVVGRDLQFLKECYYPVVASGKTGRFVVQSEEMPFLPFVEL